MAARNARPRSRVVRFARAIAWVVLGAAVLYLVAINVFVRTRLFRDVIGSDPGSLLVDYRSAYSILPGRIHVEGLRIRGRDSHVEWILTIDRCDFDVSFLQLAHKKFHASHVEGDGVSLRMRQRELFFTPDGVRSLPPVPGFSDPPYAGPKPPPLTDANYDLWTIQLDGVHAAHVREVWLDTMRYTGDVDIRGRWFFRPVRWLDIGPATVEVRALEVSHGLDEVWGWGMEGRLVATIHPFDVRVPQGLQVLHQVSLKGDASGALRLAALTSRAFDGHARVTRGDAFVEAGLDVDHGVVRPPTHLHADASPVELHAADLDFGAAVEADAIVDGDGVGHLRVDGRRLAASQEGFERARVGHLLAAVRSRRLDLADPAGDATFTADVEDAQTDSVRYWWSRAGLSSRIPLEAGEATAALHVEGTLADRSLVGSGHASVRDVVATPGSARVRSSAMKADVERIEVRARERTVRVGLAHAAVEGVTLEPSRRSGASVQVPRADVRAEGVLLAPPGVLGHVSVVVPSVRVPDAAALLGLVNTRVVRFEGGAASGAAKVDVDLGEGTATGSATLVARGLRVHAGDQTLQGDVAATVMARQSGQYTSLRGTTVAFREAAADGWWAKAWLDDGWFSLGGGPRLRGHVVLHAKDASPLESVVAERIPTIASWAMRVVPTGDLDASGEVFVTPAAVEARSVWARSDAFDLGLELLALGRRKDGALLLDVGAVRAAVDLSSGRGNVILVGAGPWFAAKSASVRAAGRRFE